MAQALLFDVGDVLMHSNWAVLDDLQKATGRPLRGRGPLDPAGDPDWLRYLAGDIPLDTYWTNKAQAAGYTGFLDLWRSMSYELQGDVFAADALQLVADARAAGVKVGILSNDLEAVTISRFPIICEIKEQLMAAGAVGALMSGSGASVFAVFADGETATVAAERLAQSRGWFTAAVTTI